MRRLLRSGPIAALVTIGLVLSSTGSALARTAPKPFGHACVASHGVRFCPTTSLAGRPRSFDGTPIDVDVTLPARGTGPFPTIALLGGLGSTKLDSETAAGTVDGSHYDSWFFAQQGYAVVTPTTRGFGNSCGTQASRTPDCAHGWFRLYDMRYEVRDVQTLLGQLVDERIANPREIGVTGVSGGGGESMMLAFLRNRIRLPDGRYAPWRSPNGTPISLAAAWPRWLWSNGESIFERNGRGGWSDSPVGVEAKAYADGIFAVAATAYLAPPSAPLSAQVELWRTETDAGILDAATRKTLAITFDYHGVAGVPGKPSPLLMQSGWTDALFPVGQSLAAYDHILAQDPKAPVALQLADLGHAPAANHLDDVRAFDQQGLRFFNFWLKHEGKPLPSGEVTAYTTVCPVTALRGGGPYRAASYARLAPGRLSFGTRKTLTISSSGASAALAAALSPLAPTGSHCALHSPDPTSKATFTMTSKGQTVLGQTVITGHVSTHGDNGQIDARLWDLNPGNHEERLVDRGVYKLTNDQTGDFKFFLDGAGWRFPKGDRIVVELLGRDAPTYAPSRTPFTARLSRVEAILPVLRRQ